MDKGAHYHRCDFQVHTPRDLNWTGKACVTDAERTAYAETLVAACREKGLDAIGITDHHDFAFFPFVKKAALMETNEQGQPLPEQQRIVVFPGLELTLGVPCQAIVLIDANFPEEFLEQVLTILGIQPADNCNAKHAQIRRLDSVNSIDKLCDELNKLSVLRGKYIVFPNVSEGGNSTMLRSCFTSAYKAMPCVGGYLDGDVSQLGQGNKNILDGKDKSYGNKRLALIQTSDNRRADHADLGKSSTWIKWAVPTAEALRQACLAQESRISQIAPRLPNMRLTEVHVSISKFFGPIDLEFNPQFNALIGGRGTGKSTILEYVRWALCDQPLAEEDDDKSSLESKRRTLIENTLKNHQAEVRVHVSVNGVEHIIKRHSTNGEINLKIADGEFSRVSELEVRKLIPVHAYSQKQLSSVGVREDELQRFLLTPINADLSKLTAEADKLRLEIRANYQELERQRSIKRELSENEAQLKSLNSQVRKLKEKLTGLSDADQLLLKIHDSLQDESELPNNWKQNIVDLLSRLQSLSAEIDGLTTHTDFSVESVDLVEALKAGAELHNRLLAKARKSIDETVSLLDETSPERKAFQKAIGEYDNLLQQHEKDYQAAKLRSSANEAVIKEISSLEGQTKEKRKAIEEQRKTSQSYEEAFQRNKELRANLNALVEARRELIGKQCNVLRDLANGQLRALLKQELGYEAVLTKIKSAVTGSAIRTKQLENVFQQLQKEENPLQVWSELLQDLEALARYDSDKDVEVPATPTLVRLGLADKDKGKISQWLNINAWLDLSLLPFQEKISFEYRIRDDEYIPFEQASAGQQATSLLGVLLNQSGPPLIIDQPEDDLDNQVIQSVVEQVWEAKKVRQLIFSSHNANLVVNGDAELVICCNYRVAGDSSGGRIETTGAIDVDDVRKAITTIMEGGKEAFDLRRQKYGF